MFIFCIFVIVKDSTLSFFDEGTIDVVDVSLDNIFDVRLPSRVVHFGKRHPFLRATCLVQVSRFGYDPEVVLLINFASEPFV